MALYLRNRDVLNLQDALAALLSPMDHDDFPAWGEAVMRSLCQLFKADGGSLILPLEDGVHFAHRGVESPIRELFESVIADHGPEGNDYRDSLLDQSMKSLRTARIVAWSSELVARLSGIPNRSVPFYNEVLVPGGLDHQVTTSARTRHGDAILAAFHGRPSDDPFGEARLDLMALLMPAFRAGARALGDFRERRGALTAALDALTTPLLVWGPPGTELYRNRALQDALSVEPDREDLIASMRTLAGEVLTLWEGTRATAIPALPVGSRSVLTRRARYGLRVSLLPSGMMTGRPAVAVILEVAAATLPEAHALRERFGLTRREAEIALLLAEGRTNPQIAERLFLSVHTVRNHAERVLQKLGVHSRSAVAVTLLGGSDRPPARPE